MIQRLSLALCLALALGLGTPLWAQAWSFPSISCGHVDVQCWGRTDQTKPPNVFCGKIKWPGHYTVKYAACSPKGDFMSTIDKCAEEFPQCCANNSCNSYWSAYANIVNIMAGSPEDWRPPE